jgi:tetratricopeptide (TPR) repeat protein
MSFKSIHVGLKTIAILIAAGLAVAQGTSAQYQQQPQQQQPQPQPQQQQPTPAPSGKAAPQTAPQAPAEAPKIDPEEEKAYKAFSDTSAPQQADARIKLGEQFLAKYPKSKYAEQVYARLMQDYLDKQQFDKMYDAADKALALNPDNVTVLVIEGWVIPHNYNPDDPDAEKRLNQAEVFEKHAIDVISKLTKPANLTDEQFAKAKDLALSQAHSGLGLIYFRRQDYANSVTELQAGEKIAATPDPTDFYVMGVELQALKRFSEAADVYQKCAQIPGGLADRCKSKVDEAKKQASAQPAAPKP